MQQHHESFELNRLSWDERVEAHWASDMYQRHADALRAGTHSLAPDIVEGVGHVHGKRLLHLQCHMGMETLMWSRLGAEAVGVDFSQPAIDKANQLRDELSLGTRFHCANVYDARSVVEGAFDIAFVSIGSLCWLPDVRQWAQVVAACLKPGGQLFLNDVHPLLSMLENSDAAPGFEMRYPYLGGERMLFECESTYADQDARFENVKSAEWTHPLGEIVSAVIEAGMRLESLKESSTCVWPALRVMQQAGPDDWAFPQPWTGKIPVSFTLTATR